MTTTVHNYSLRATALATAFAAACTPFGFANAGSTLPPSESASGAIMHDSADVTIPVVDRVRTRLRATIAELIANGAFGNLSTHSITLDVDAPGQRVSDLGVLVDSGRAAGDGLHVLGVTPGSAAEKMGLRAGDVLMAANGAVLGGNGAAAAASLRRSVDTLPSGATLAFDVDRAGQTQAMSGVLTSVYVPAMRLHIGDAEQVALNGSGASTADSASAQATTGCGRISDFDVAPRQQQLHAAKIIKIDGQAPGPSGAKSFRVAAGSHVVTVYNEIESQYLPFNDMQRNSGLSLSHYKKLTVDIAPNTTTLIAAHLNIDKRNDWQNDAYWDPIAWKQVAEACR